MWSTLKMLAPLANPVQPGDWHDTIQLPVLNGSGIVSLRVQPGEHTGYAVVHCHFLNHEGALAMAVFLWVH